MRSVRGTRSCALIGLVVVIALMVVSGALFATSAAADLAELVEGNTAFALDLYAEVRATSGNLVFSPLSISTALGMTHAGARDATALQMAEVLRFTLPEARLHAAFATLLGELGGTDTTYELAVANSLWGQRGSSLQEEFLDLTREHYGTELQEVDFRESEKARRAINAWVAEKTRHRIEQLLQPGDVGPATRLVLVNAIYFGGDWAHAFSEGRTEEADFHISAVETARVPMMRQTEAFRYADFAELELLELPYAGDELSMVVLLPAPEEGLGVLETQLSPENLARWLDALAKRDVMVALPRFTMRTRLGLADVLSEMGMPTVFSLEADFSGMTGERDFYVDGVLHEAFIEVDETGTEAVAATAVTMELTAMPFDPPVEFRVDRPFVFLLRHRPTGSILFMGRVVDPR